MPCKYEHPRWQVKLFYFKINHLEISRACPAFASRLGFASEDQRTLEVQAWLGTDVLYAGFPLCAEVVEAQAVDAGINQIT